MPNYVTHRVRATGKNLNQFFQECFIKDNFDFNTLIPMPEVLKDTVSGSPNLMANEKNLQATIETGFSNWYDWSIEKWGTKWNVCDTNIIDRTDNHLEFMFDTAWSPPTPVFQAIANKYPNLEMDIKAFDEEWGFAYQANIEDGVFSEEQVEADKEMYELVYGEAPEEEEED